MFNLQIVDTDAFLEMPASSQLLYFHLSMRADDEGFVGNPRKIIKTVGVNDDDLKVLIAKRFVISFESGIVVIKHWKINNYLQNDRLKETVYTEEKALLKTKDNKSYTERIQNVSKCLGSIDKSSIGKDSIDRVVYDPNDKKDTAEIKQVLDVFYRINPTLNWGNKTFRDAAADLIKRFGLEETVKMAEFAVSIQGQPYAPVVTTPYELKEKLAKVKIYFDKQKGERRTEHKVDNF